MKLDENATHFDKIAAAAHQKFNTLAATVMESMVGRKVMAAIVMTSDQISIDSGCVISLATGQCYLVIDTHAHPFSSPFSGTTRVSWYQKGKTDLDFTEARDSEWQWHQLGHMQVCNSLQTDNHASTPPLSFLQA